MTEYNSIIDQDWDELALDDGSFVVEFENYVAKIHPRGSGEILESEIDSIRYNTEVNAANPITVDVEPFSELESTDYLGGILDVFVGSDPLFSGRIVKIETNQNDGEYYSIKAEPPGKKLKGRTLDEHVDVSIVSDYLAKVIDRYNEYDSEFDEMVNTSDEVLSSGIEEVGNVRESTADGETVTYQSVGSNASEIDVIYVKSIVEPTIDLNIITPNDSVSYTIENIEEGTYGGWEKIELDQSIESAEYDLEFVLSNGSILYDWIVITNEEISRNVEPNYSETVEQKRSVQNLSSTVEFEDALGNQIADDNPLAVENGRLHLKQSGFFWEAYENDTENESFEYINEDFSTGEGRELASSISNLIFKFNLDYTIPAEEFLWGFRYDGRNRTEIPPFYVYLDGEQIFHSPNTGGLLDELRWFDFDNEPSSDVEAGNHEFEIEIDNDNYESGSDSLIIDCVWVGDARYHNIGDNTVHEPSGYLDYPTEFAEDPIKIEFPEAIASQNISKAYIDVDAGNKDPVSTLGLSLDGGENFEYVNNSNSIESENPSFFPSIIGTVEMAGSSSNGARSTSPRYNYESQEINEWDLTADIESLEIIYKRDFSDNRLAVISKLADESNFFFRWEGKECRIFERGSRQTQPNLRKEKVSSSVDIEDVYSSCEVIGSGGVTSGIVESDDAPVFVDKHKEIRDPSIETEQEATRRAISFLEENGTIDYSGKITTLPTKAPIGEMLDGSNFNHGQDTFIEKVNYGKRRSTISLGKSKNLKNKILDIDRDNSSMNARNT